MNGLCSSKDKKVTGFPKFRFWNNFYLENLQPPFEKIQLFVVANLHVVVATILNTEVLNSCQNVEFNGLLDGYIVGQKSRRVPKKNNRHLVVFSVEHTVVK